MIVRRREHGRDSKMPCESCAVQFSVFKRKRVCSECERCYCSACLRRGGGAMCAPCRVLSTRPLSRLNIAHLRVRDLQCFLQRQNVSTRGCVEKEELVGLCVSHVNSAAYRRRGARGSPGAFSSLKGLTTNINEFLNSAFDLRTPPASPPHPHAATTNASPPPRSCHNSTHAHAPPAPTPAPAPAPACAPERFPTTPGVTVEGAGGAGARVDTADCFEIEDLDELGWELVRAPAAPLPNDSDVLLSTTESGEALRDREPTPDREPEPGRGHGTDSAGSTLRPGLADRHRAASELELRSAPSDSDADTASLQEHPLVDSDGRSPVSLEQLREAAALEALSVRQLKELLARNRVEYRGCVERAELLARARTLWRDHQRHRGDIELLPLEESCKICMAAPLECVLLECGHIAACTACARQLAECPICRQYVVRAVRCFRS